MHFQQAAASVQQPNVFAQIQWVHGNSISKNFKLRNKRFTEHKTWRRTAWRRCNKKMNPAYILKECVQKRKMERQMHYENRAHKQSHVLEESELLSRTVIKCVYSVQKLMHHHDQRAITVIKWASSSRLSFRHLPHFHRVEWIEIVNDIHFSYWMLSKLFMDLPCFCLPQ